MLQQQSLEEFVLPPYYLQLLGVPSLTGPIRQKKLPDREPSHVLVLIALLAERGSIARQMVRNLLWASENAPPNEDTAFRSKLKALKDTYFPEHRKIFGPPGTDIALDQSLVQVDVYTFNKLCDAAEKHVHLAECIVPLAEALALYNGPLVENFTAYYFVSERHKLHRTYVKAVYQLGLACIHANIPQATELLYQLIQIMPDAQLLHYHLACLFVDQGRRDQAKDVLERLMQYLLITDDPPIQDVKNLLHALNEGEERGIEKILNEWDLPTKLPILDEDLTVPDDDSSSVYEAISRIAKTAVEHPAAQVLTQPYAPIIKLDKYEKVFCGRDTLKEHIKSLFKVSSGGCICLYGLGGIGKSQLALRVAYNTLTVSPDTESFPDGLLQVDVSTIKNRVLVQ